MQCKLHKRSRFNCLNHSIARCRRAQRLRRSVEGEVVALLSAALPTLDDLPAPLADEMAQLVFLSDAELWRTARSELSLADNERMQELAYKRQRVGSVQAGRRGS